MTRLTCNARNAALCRYDNLRAVSEIFASEPSGSHAAQLKAEVSLMNRFLFPARNQQKKMLFAQMEKL